MDIRVELYQFKHGDKAWYFTNHRKDVTHNGITYKSVRGLDRDAIEDADIDKCEIEVTFPQISLKNDAGDNLTSVFLNKIYFESVYLTVLELEKNVTLVLFIGRVTQPKFDDSVDTMTLICSTGESHLNRTMLTMKFQKTCPYSIYNRWCGLDFDEWAFDATVTGISGLTVTFKINPTQVKDDEGNPIFDVNNNPIMETKTYSFGYLSRGLLKKLGVYTFIVDGTHNTARLYREHADLKVGDVIQLAPGCDQSSKTCDSTFNNGARFGGHPYISNENPIYGQLIK